MWRHRFVGHDLGSGLFCRRSFRLGLFRRESFRRRSFRRGSFRRAHFVVGHFVTVISSRGHLIKIIFFFIVCIKKNHGFIISYYYSYKFIPKEKKKFKKKHILKAKNIHSNFTSIVFLLQLFFFFICSKSLIN
jgi:hypothetical protein